MSIGGRSRAVQKGVPGGRPAVTRSYGPPARDCSDALSSIRRAGEVLKSSSTPNT